MSWIFNPFTQNFDWVTTNAIDGSGTANTVPKFSDANTLTDSSITDDGTDVKTTLNFIITAGKKLIFDG